MATLESSLEGQVKESENRGILLGGYAAMAESAWMGSVQAADVLE